MSEPKTLAELAAFVELAILASSEGLSRGLRCDLNNHRDLASMLLLYAVLDYARAVVVRAKGGAKAGIPVVARSAMNAYVDIALLGDHADYWRNLEAVDRGPPYGLVSAVPTEMHSKSSSLSDEMFGRLATEYCGAMRAAARLRFAQRLEHETGSLALCRTRFLLETIC